MDDFEKKKLLIEKINKLLVEESTLGEIKTLFIYASNGNEAFEWLNGNGYEMLGYMESKKHLMLNPSEKAKNEPE